MVGVARGAAVWAALGCAVAVPLGAAALSPLLQWRDGVYIAGGFAGVVGLALMLLQPLAAVGGLPGLSRAGSRRLHRLIGAALVVAVVIHVAGLWITSPWDVIDALLFRSPTPFSVWGVLAMWGLFAAALLVLRRRRVRPRLWRRLHTALAGLVVVGTVTHAMLIVGTMETLSKSALCGMVLAAAAWAIVRSGAWGMPRG